MQRPIVSDMAGVMKRGAFVRFLRVGTDRKPCGTPSPCGAQNVSLFWASRVNLCEAGSPSGSQLSCATQFCRTFQDECNMPLAQTIPEVRHTDKLRHPMILSVCFFFRCFVSFVALRKRRTGFQSWIHQTILALATLMSILPIQKHTNSPVPFTGTGHYLPCLVLIRGPQRWARTSRKRVAARRANWTRFLTLRHKSDAGNTRAGTRVAHCASVC